ncbi:MAG: acetyl-CoA decarbonylase/synthase complex subunit gamma [Candidatus Omnitrophica bacterium]|nr:acetyl-CoA decarbonylase/synthase complex subunit gamma [Candidatus Omnitrophota bacterium]
MPLSGLDIYKLLPKTNCRRCGLSTCLAFAMQLAKKTMSADKCPFISEQTKKLLEEQSQPAIRTLILGEGKDRFEAGGETVMFRHEEKFRNPCGIGFVIEDSLSDEEIASRVKKINSLKFERVGQVLDVNMVAVRQNSDQKRFVRATEIVMDSTGLPVVLMGSSPASLRQAASAASERKPLLYCATKDNFTQIASIAKDFRLPVVVSAPSLDELSYVTKELVSLGVDALLLDTGRKPLSEKIWDATQIRRQALRKANRVLGYPEFVMAENDDPYEEAAEAAVHITKYASVIILKGIQSWEALSVLTLRQNIYTDPQKPLQIEPRLYPVGEAGENSPVLVTTNFSLTYYTVLGEVEASKIPSYIISVDTEGMSVLTAWAAEKFTAQAISDSLENSGIKKMIKHKNLIIPGYVAVLSGELEEKSGFKVIVGPKEAAGIPSFLKNLN